MNLAFTHFYEEVFAITLKPKALQTYAFAVQSKRQTQTPSKPSPKQFSKGIFKNFKDIMGRERFELSTFRLSAERSNQAELPAPLQIITIFSFY